MKRYLAIALAALLLCIALTAFVGCKEDEDVIRAERGDAQSCFTLRSIWQWRWATSRRRTDGGNYSTAAARTT